MFSCLLMPWLFKDGMIEWNWQKYSTKSHIQCPGHKSHTATSERPDAAHLSQERPGFRPGHVFPHQPSAWEGFSWGSGPSWVLGVHCFITQGTETADNRFLMMLVLVFWMMCLPRARRDPAQGPTSVVRGQAQALSFLTSPWGLTLFWMSAVLHAPWTFSDTPPLQNMSSGIRRVPWGVA